jgi:hypothetical protein
VFSQQTAHDIADAYDEVIYICGRYEGIDHRVKVWCENEFGQENLNSHPQPLSQEEKGAERQIDFEVISL